eukprot:UN23906
MTVDVEMLKDKNVEMNEKPIRGNNDVNKSKENKTNSENENDAKIKKLMNQNIFYSDIPNINFFKKGLTPKEITKLNLDKTEILQKVLNDMKNDIYLFLGELSFAFVNFLLGQCLEGLEQWRTMITLICDCRDGLEMFPKLYEEFLEMLHEQCEELPQDFFNDPLLTDNFLQKCLINIYETFGEREKDLTKNIKTNKEKLHNLLKKKFKFDVTEFF